MRALLVTMAGAPMTPSWFMPDNGLAQLAACLLAAGHEVTVLDLNTLATLERLAPPAEPLEVFDALGRELAERVRRDRVGLVGFKLWNGDALDASFRMAAAVRAEVGRDVLIVGGGPQVDFFGDAVPKDAEAAAFDAFAVAEGEPVVEALAEVVEGRRALDRVPNLLIRGRDGGVSATAVTRVGSLEGLPLAVYDPEVYPLEGKALAATYEETRGCPYGCAFCNHPLKAGHEMRTRSPARAAAEMRFLAERHGFRGFKLGGSYTPSAYMRELAAALLEPGRPIRFCSYGRLNDAEEADFPLYRRAGCEALFFGLETGEQLILDRKIHKGFKVGAAARVLKACRAAGIFTIASIIYPNPGETPESRRATLDLLADVRPDGAPVHFPILLPGSGWFARPERYGFAVPDHDAYVRTALRYKARLLFPPEFWPPIPYSIDGKPFASFAAECAAFAKEVEALGVVTLISDEAAMLARLAGLEPRAFRDLLRRAFIERDVSAAASFVDAVNAGGPGGAPCAPEGREVPCELASRPIG